MNTDIRGTPRRLAALLLAAVILAGFLLPLARAEGEETTAGTTTPTEETTAPTEGTTATEATTPTTVPVETTDPTEPTVPVETTDPAETTAPEETTDPTETTEPSNSNTLLTSSASYAVMVGDTIVLPVQANSGYTVTTTDYTAQPAYQAATSIVSGGSYLIANYKYPVSAFLTLNNSVLDVATDSSGHLVNQDDGTYFTIGNGIVPTTWTLAGSGDSYTIASGNSYLTLGSDSASVSATSQDLTLTSPGGDNGTYYTIASADSYLLSYHGGLTGEAAGTDSAGEQWYLCQEYGTAFTFSAAGTYTVTSADEQDACTVIVTAPSAKTITATATTLGEGVNCFYLYWTTDAFTNRNSGNSTNPNELYLGIYGTNTAVKVTDPTQLENAFQQVTQAGTDGRVVVQLPDSTTAGSLSGGYVLFFVYPDEGYLIDAATGSGAGNLYPIDAVSDNDSSTKTDIDYDAGIDVVIAAAKEYLPSTNLLLFQWGRPSTLSYSPTYALTAVKPEIDLQVVATTGSSSTTPKEGDTVTFTITLTPTQVSGSVLEEVVLTGLTIKTKEGTAVKELSQTELNELNADLTPSEDGTYYTVTYDVVLTDGMVDGSSSFTVTAKGTATYNYTLSLKVGSYTTYSTAEDEDTKTVEITPQYDVTHKFVNGTNSKTLPAGVTNQLPVVATLNSGTVYTPTTNFTSVTDGYVTWEFVGWYSDKDLTTPLTSLAVEKDVTIYGKWIMTVDATFSKIVGDGVTADAGVITSGTPPSLSGAKFTAYPVDDSGGKITTGDTYTAVSDANGVVTLAGLPAGATYWIEETTTPAGYLTPTWHWLVEIDADGTVTFTCPDTSTGMYTYNSACCWPNYQLYELPTTGGHGIYLPMALGGLLMCSASAALFGRRKRAKGARR